MDSPVPGMERRQHKRRALRTTAHVMLPDQQFLEVYTVDISAGGLAVVTDLNPRAGTRFYIRVNLPGRSGRNTVLEASVEVTNSIFGTVEQGFKVGLRFLKLEPAALLAVIQYVERGS